MNPNDSAGPLQPPPLMATGPIGPDLHFELVAMGENSGPGAVLEAILKYPGRILFELRSGRIGVCWSLALIAVICLSVYGLVAGSLSGGTQLWQTPAKILLGSVLCAVLCLPSLYIFLCLRGVDTTLKLVSGELLAAICLMSLLMIGFAPVAWVFSQSTDSVALMAAFHLMFWGIGLWFGLRLLGRISSKSTARPTNLSAWVAIYLLVCLQMMTTLRPILGHSEHFVQGKKMFFLAHFWETLNTPSAESRY